jgi:hypothetical protein
MTGKNRTPEGRWHLRCRINAGEALAISIPRSEGGGDPGHLQERMPYGLFVPDVPS